MKTVTPKLAILHALTDAQIAALADLGETPQPAAAVLLGQTALESMETLAALKSAPLAPIGENPKLVAPVRLKSARQYIRRDDGAVTEFSIRAPQPVHTLKGAAATPDVL